MKSELFCYYNQVNKMRTEPCSLDPAREVTGNQDKSYFNEHWGSTAQSSSREEESKGMSGEA